MENKEATVIDEEVKAEEATQIEEDGTFTKIGRWMDRNKKKLAISAGIAIVAGFIYSKVKKTDEDLDENDATDDEDDSTEETISDED